MSLPSICGLLKTDGSMIDVLYAYTNRWNCIERALGLGSWDDPEDFIPNVWRDLYIQNPDNKYTSSPRMTKFIINDGTTKTFPTRDELCGISYCDILSNLDNIANKLNGILIFGSMSGVYCSDLALGPNVPTGFIDVYTGVYPSFASYLTWDTNINTVFSNAGLSTGSFFSTPHSMDIFKGEFWEKIRLGLEHAKKIWYRSFYKSFKIFVNYRNASFTDFFFLVIIGKCGREK